MAKSPAKNKWPADSVERRPAPQRERACCDCGKIEMVRRDSTAIRCRSCSGRMNGLAGVASIKAKAIAKQKPCQNCGESHSNKKFCSKKCKSESAERVERKCKQCDQSFTVLASTLRSNASGNFCSRGCYESFLCRTERTTGRGSQWAKIRQDVIKDAPFCAMCGTTKNLQVHHIIPFRLTHDNSFNNLVPLCVKHHRMVETILVSTEKFGFDCIAQAAWVGMIRERQAATAVKMREVASAAI